MQYADIVVPRGGQNRVAVQLIVEHVKDQLKQVTSPGLVPWLMVGWHIAALYSLLPVCVQRGFNNRSKLLDGQGGAQALPSSVHLLPSKPQVKAMHTVIRSAPPSSSEPCFIGGVVCRNKDTKRDEFVFFTNRLACLAMEYALSLLPFQVCCSHDTL